MLDGTSPDEIYRRLVANPDQETTQHEQRLQDIDAAQEVGELHLTADLMRDWPKMPMHAQREMLSRLVRRIDYTAQRPYLDVKIMAKWEDS